jgi:hypothetical protein
LKAPSDLSQVQQGQTKFDKKFHHFLKTQTNFKQLKMKKNNIIELKSQINLKLIKKLMRIFFIDSSSSKDVKKIFLAFLNIEKYFK